MKYLIILTLFSLIWRIVVGYSGFPFYTSTFQDTKGLQEFYRWKEMSYEGFDASQGITVCVIS